MARQWLPVVAFLGSWSTSPALGGAQRPEYESQYLEVTRALETPHTKWAQPYAGRAPRVLFIGPRGVMREVVEVAQRMSLDYQAVIVHTRWQLGGDPNQSYQRIIDGLPDDVARHLREKLRERPDAIVVGNLQWKILPEDIEYEILRQVRDGCGLVLSFIDQPTDHLTRFLERAKPEAGLEVVCSGVPFEGLEAWRDLGTGTEAGGRIVSLRRFGRGRVALLNYGRAAEWTLLTPPVGSSAADRPWLWDYYLSLPIRTILWAVGREPKARLTGLSIGAAEGPAVVDVARGPGPRRLEVVWQVEIPLARPRIAFRLRGADGETLGSEEKAALQQGGALVQDWPLAATVQRRHFADVWLKDGEAVVDWASLAFTPTGASAIKALALVNDSIGPDEACPVKVTLRDPAAEGLTLRCSAFDAYGRLVAETKSALAAGQAEATVTLATGHLIGNALRIRCSLMAGEREVDRDWVWQPVALAYPHDEFGFLVWAGPGDEFIPHYVGQVLAEAGVDTINHGGGVILARHGLRGVPGIRAGLHFSECKVTDHKRTPCFNDPAHRATVRERLLSVARDHVRFGATGYTLGDDNNLAPEDVCFCDFCQADFRRYLKDMYGSLEALNAEWNTQFGSWDEVGPALLDEALKQGHIAQWADHRRHMESVWADFHGFARDTVREVDPTARVGSDAACGVGSYGGYDWWRLSKVLGLWNVYPDPIQVEALRCFHAPEAYTGIWYGGYLEQRYDAYERWAPWYSIFHQLSAAWWFQSFPSASEPCQELAVASDLTPFKPFVTTSEEIAEIKRGVGKLLLAAKRNHDGVGVLYSQASMHASTIDSSAGTAEGARRAWVDLLEDVGLQYEFVATEQVEGGALLGRGYRVLVLPACFALSDREIAALDAFAQAGGAVIADVRPGIRDGHCKATGSPARRALFGVSYTANGQRVPAGKRTGKLTLAGRELPYALNSVVADASVQPEAGTVAASPGTPPCLLTCRRGKGSVLLLNFGIEGYAKAQPETAWLRELIGPALRACGARPVAEVAPQSGEPMDVEQVSFSDGVAGYLGLTRWHWAQRATQSFKVTLADARHVYDARAGKYLGERGTFDVTLGQGKSALYALLPYQVTGCKVTAMQSARRGELLQARIALQATGPRARHAIHVELVDPSGRRPRWYAQNVALAAEAVAAAVAIPLALNDPVGAWQVVARDAATGASGKASVEVR